MIPTRQGSMFECVTVGYHDNKESVTSVLYGVVSVHHRKFFVRLPNPVVTIGDAFYLNSI